MDAEGLDTDPVRAGEHRSTRLSVSGALGWFVVSYGFAVLGYLVLYAVAGRFLGKQSFGTFTIVITATAVLGQMALVGADRAGLREAAKLRDVSEQDLALLRGGVRAVCLTTLPLVGLIVTAASWVLLGSGHGVGERLFVACAAGVLVVLSGQQKLWANYLRGFGDLKFAGLLEGRSGGALVSLLQALFAVLVWVFAPGTGLSGLLVGAALGYLLPVLAAHRIVHRRWRSARLTVRLRDDLRRVVARDWRFMSGQAASYLNANFELWAAGLLLTAADTSLFGAAQRICLLVVTPLTSLQVVFAPVIVRGAHDGDTGRLGRLLRTGATLAAVPMLALLLPILIFPSTILTVVFGNGYGGGAVTLLFLTVGSVANVLTGMCGAVLTMTHHEGVVASLQWWGLGARIVVGTALALTVGLNGLGASAGVCTAVLWFAMWWAARSRAGLWTHPTLSPQPSLLRTTSG